MKKILSYFITLIVIALAAIFTVTSTSSTTKNSLFMENVAALAQVLDDGIAQTGPEYGYVENGYYYYFCANVGSQSCTSGKIKL